MVWRSGPPAQGSKPLPEQHDAHGVGGGGADRRADATGGRVAGEAGDRVGPLVGDVEPALVGAEGELPGPVASGGRAGGEGQAPPGILHAERGDAVLAAV